MAAYIPSLSSSDKPRSYSDLLFDFVIRYVAIVSGLLSVLSFGGEIFSSGVTCSETSSKTNSELTRAAFINKWCSRRHLGSTQLFPFFLALQSLAIYAPSLLWNRAFASRFTSFFADINSTSRQELRFGQLKRMIPELLSATQIEWDVFSRRMLWLYIAKLVAQVAFTVTAFVFFAVFFDSNPILSVFICDLAATELSLDVTVECVFPPGPSLEWLRIANFIVLFVGFFFAGLGLLWTVGPGCQPNDFCNRRMSDDRDLFFTIIRNTDSGLANSIDGTDGRSWDEDKAIEKMHKELTGGSFSTACRLYLSYLKEKDFCLKCSLITTGITKSIEAPRNCHIFHSEKFDQVLKLCETVFRERNVNVNSLAMIVTLTDGNSERDKHTIRNFVRRLSEVPRIILVVGKGMRGTLLAQQTILELQRASLANLKWSEVQTERIRCEVRDCSVVHGIVALHEACCAGATSQGAVN